MSSYSECASRRISPFPPAHYTGISRADRPAQPLSRSDARVVRGRLHRADASAGAGMAGDRARRFHADPGADRHRQNARRLSVVHRPPDVRAGPGERPALPRPLHFADQGAGGRRGAQSARAAGRDRDGGAVRRRRLSRAGDRDPHRRHSGGRARALRATAGRHPDHHAGIDLPAADFASPRNAAVGGDRGARRDSRAGADQARLAPGALAGTPGSAVRAQAAAHRTLRHAAPAGRSRALSGRRGDGGGAEEGARGRCHAGDPRRVRIRGRRAAVSRGHHRRRQRAQAHRPAHRSADRRHDEARRTRRAAQRAGVGARRCGPRSGARSIPSCWSWCARTPRR